MQDKFQTGSYPPPPPHGKETPTCVFHGCEKGCRKCNKDTGVVGGEGLNRFVPPNGGPIREGPYQGEGLFEKTVKLTVSSSKIWQ